MDSQVCGHSEHLGTPVNPVADSQEGDGLMVLSDYMRRGWWCSYY